MPNTVQLHLLSNKQVKAEMQGIPLATDNAYRIIAGEENSTIFSIETKPSQYSAFDYYVILVNSQGYKVPLDPTEGTEVEGENGQLLIGTTFTLPKGMAVAGYGFIGIYAKGVNSDLQPEKVVFQPIKVKVWNTVADWHDEIPEGQTPATQEWVEDYVTNALAEIDLSGLVPDSRTIAGLDLTQNRSKADMLTALGFSITEVTI